MKEPRRVREETRREETSNALDAFDLCCSFFFFDLLSPLSLSLSFDFLRFFSVNTRVALAPCAVYLSLSLSLLSLSKGTLK